MSSELNRLLFGLLADPAEEQRKRSERNHIARCRRRAKKLAADMNIKLEVEVYYEDFGRPVWSCWICDDRLEGDRFCSSWEEVAEKLEHLKLWEDAE